MYRPEFKLHGRVHNFGSVEVHAHLIPFFPTRYISFACLPACPLPGPKPSHANQASSSQDKKSEGKEKSLGLFLDLLDLGVLNWPFPNPSILFSFSPEISFSQFLFRARQEF